MVLAGFCHSAVQRGALFRLFTCLLSKERRRRFDGCSLSQHTQAAFKALIKTVAVQLLLTAPREMLATQLDPTAQTRR
jgi:hypothetical protein